MTVNDPWEGLRGNLLLQSLNARDARLIAPHLKRIDLDEGQRIVPTDMPVGCVYFPESAVACLCASGIGSRGLEIGLIGREGVVGWQALLGGDAPAPASAIQIAGGTALVLTTHHLLAGCAASPTLVTSLLRYVHILTVQMAQTIVSNLSDPLDRRLSRWLLMLHDRIDGDLIAVTHNSLASLLNVRRASVTDALHLLEGDHVLSCSRGRISIRDRALLERRAGSAYGVPERAYRATIGPFGKVP